MFVDIDKLEEKFALLQSDIFNNFLSLEKDLSVGDEDIWNSDIAKGHVKIISEGAAFEKAIASFSMIKSSNLPNSSNILKKFPKSNGYIAMGVSVIAHPLSPLIPTSHLNVRIFLIFDNDSLIDWWIGGGCDLTPFFESKEDFRFWHKSLKSYLDSYDKSLYKLFAKQCDEYFYLPHRNEKRGIGGIFFDDYKMDNIDNSLSFLKDLVKTYNKNIYQIVNHKIKDEYNENHREFQKIRRGRYVEFNLLHDRGTKFGLESGGRTKSILSSLPPAVSYPFETPEHLLEFEKKLNRVLETCWIINQ